MKLIPYFLGIATAMATLGVVFEMLRRRRMRERHAFWWLLLGSIALIVSVFPKILDWLSEILGLQLPINLVFFLSAFILFLVCIQHSTEITTLESKTRSLAEIVALQELRLKALEDSTNNQNSQTESKNPPTMVKKKTQ